MTEERWHADPFCVHKHRWPPGVTPQVLVQDRRTISQKSPQEAARLVEIHLIEPPSIAEGALHRLMLLRA
jgi:hypothetical protein